jgi:flotillin
VSALDLPPVFLIALASLVIAGFAVARGLRWSWKVAAPDEWLLQVRDGRLVRAGIGISIWRRPGDMMARFTSTVQRVAFTATGPSQEQLPVAIDGFLLWSVDPDAGGPFRAFRSLGLADLQKPPLGLKNKKHLLTGPHHAFQSLIAAEVSQLASTRPFTELLHDRSALLERLADRLARLGTSLGISISQVEISAVRPADATLSSDLAAREEQEHRQEAAEARVAANERIEQARLEAAARIAREKEDRAQAQRLAEEAGARQLAEARRSREDAEHDAMLDRLRREAEARRDAALLSLEAEERKSEAIRQTELARFAAEKVAEAFGRLPIKDAHWVSCGESPAATIAALVDGVRRVLH